MDTHMFCTSTPLQISAAVNGRGLLYRWPQFLCQEFCRSSKRENRIGWGWRRLISRRQLVWFTATVNEGSRYVNIEASAEEKKQIGEEALEQREEESAAEKIIEWNAKQNVSDKWSNVKAFQSNEPSTHPSIHPSVHASMLSTSYPPTHPQSSNPYSQPDILVAIHPATQPASHSQPLTHSSICPSIYLFIFLSISVRLYLYAYQSTCMSVMCLSVISLFINIKCSWRLRRILQQLWGMSKRTNGNEGRETRVNDTGLFWKERREWST